MPTDATGELARIRAATERLTTAADLRRAADTTQEQIGDVTRLAAGTLDWGDGPMQMQTAMRNLSDARVRINAAVDAFDRLQGAQPVPPPALGEIRAAIVNGWAVSLTIQSVAEALPSASLINDLLQLAAGAAEVVGEGVPKIVAPLAKGLDALLKGIVTNLWPWLLVAAAVFFFVYVRRGA